jgi:alpha-galactosidase
MIAGHNQFRRMMFAHYLPRGDGEPVGPPVACNGTAALYVRAQEDNAPLGTLNEAGELDLIDKIADLGCEAYWMDAYWYPQPWMANLGNWYPRPDDFPNGLRPLADAAHAKGMEFVLWFLPPGVSAGTQWAKEYPQFIYGATPGSGGLWNMADPKARSFLTDWLCDRIREWDVDIYREDGSGLPPEEGPEERVGMSEMLHVEGLYTFWSDVLERNPGLRMDNCCGGGNRIDIETAQQAFYLWRSDLNDIGEGLRGKAHWPYMATADQVMVTGLSLYVPFHTGPVWDMSPYSFRSAMASGTVLYNDLDAETFSSEQARLAIAELKELRPLFDGDIFPLLRLTALHDDWYAFQLDRADLSRGCVLLFRRPDSPYSVCDVQLHGIDEDAQYAVGVTGETYDPGPESAMSGRELRELSIAIRERPGSALVRYRRQ